MSNYHCAEQCQFDPLLYKSNRYTRDGAKYCDKCECYYKREYGLRCKCCHKVLRSRLKCRSENTKRWKECQREIKEQNLIIIQLDKAHESRLIQRRIENTEYIFGCRGCDYTTEHLGRWKLHRTPGHRIKVIPIGPKKEEKNIKESELQGRPQIRIQS